MLRHSRGVERTEPSANRTANILDALFSKQVVSVGAVLDAATPMIVEGSNM
jgi:hypothetical protein